MLEKFKNNYKLSSDSEEMMVPSLFARDDYKRHMSVNTHTGLWQCFKSGEKGNFFHLVAIIDKTSYNQAESKFMLKDLLEEGEVTPKLAEPKPPPQGVKNLIPITKDMAPESPLTSKAWLFINHRKLWGSTEYFVAKDGDYRDRLIIPFFYLEKIVFFQARALDNATQPKYLNFKGIKKAHILYPYDHEQDHLVVCEGPLDAISLQIQGVNATATMGSTASLWQVNVLSEFKGKVILGYDNDGAGENGVNYFEEMRKVKRMDNLYICPPPKGHKDWNEAHVADYDLSAYVSKNSKLFDFEYKIDKEIKSL